MLIEFIFIILLSLIPACFNYFLDYCLGKPMSNEPSTKAIFSRYSIWIAEQRLRKLKIKGPIYKDFLERLKSENRQQREDAERQYKETVLITAQRYYSFEQAIGMCPFCTGFWCSLFSAGVIYLTVPFHHFNPFFLFILIPVFSHTILRKL